LKKKEAKTQLYAPKTLWIRVWKMREIYVLIFVPFILMFIFSYWPMYGAQVAFRDFKINKGIWGSPWIGLDNIKRFLNDMYAVRCIVNTLRISIVGKLFFPVPIIFALLLNELVNTKFKRVVQTISYMPHFMSAIVISGFVMQLLSPDYGVVNTVLEKFGKEPYYFLGDPKAFVPILTSTGIWAGVGWSAIVYLAAIAGIDQELYESAAIDGTNRLQNALYITLPSITPMITILFILSMQGILSAGFDMVYNLKNNLNQSTSLTMEVYVFEQGIMGARYSYAQAIGLFQQAIGLCFVFLTNFIVKKINDQGIF